MINVGYNNYVSIDKIVAIISPDSAPIKRMIQNLRDSVDLINATSGRKTRSVIILQNRQIMLSALQAETLTQRLMEAKKQMRKGKLFLL